MSREVCFEEMSDNDMLKGLTQNTFISNESNFTEGPDNCFVFEDVSDKDDIAHAEEIATNFNNTVSKEEEDSGFFEYIVDCSEHLDEKAIKSISLSHTKNEYMSKNTVKCDYFSFSNDKLLNTNAIEMEVDTSIEKVNCNTNIIEMEVDDIIEEFIRNTKIIEMEVDNTIEKFICNRYIIEMEVDNTIEEFICNIEI